MLSMKCPLSTLKLLLKSVLWRELYTQCMLKLMTCFIRLRIQKRKQRRQWLMLLVLLMNSVLNKTILIPSQRQRGPLNLSLVNLKISLLKQMKMPCVVDVPQWLSSKQGSVSLKLNLEMFKLTLAKMQRDIRSPNAAARNLYSRLMKTKRTKTAWQSWPLSSSKRSKLTKSRLRKLKKLLRLILPSSASPSRSLRRPKSVQGWPRLSCQSTTKQYNGFTDQNFGNDCPAPVQHTVTPLH